ncbi:hypothetical protein V9T40_009327 [Parthenolecanium corni]|uniref:G-protein coupled receptors family 1 profile domain-containing protein n=1 Tax=Parthenolecanium corni TaxID=536013 RepID=A0AAN9TPM3_9HEMI
MPRSIVGNVFMNASGPGIFDTARSLILANTSMEMGAQNTSSPVDDDLGEMKNVIATLVLLLFSAIVVVGLIGNSLVVVVVSFNQQMRSTTNLLIINLAVADLLFIVFCVPFTATDYILPYWPFGDLWCKCVQYLIVVTAYASVYTLVLMSLDRFLAVVHPIASMYVRTEKNANTAIFIIWGVIVLLAVPVFYRYGEVTYGSIHGVSHTGCVFLDQDRLEGHQGYNQPVYQVRQCYETTMLGRVCSGRKSSMVETRECKPSLLLIAINLRKALLLVFIKKILTFVTKQFQAHILA